MHESDAIAARVRTATICGRRYLVQFEPDLGPDYGHCEYPANGQPGSIAILETLSGVLLLDTLIHEAIHAAYPELGEGRVRRGASDVARLLWRAGYRVRR